MAILDVVWHDHIICLAWRRTLANTQPFAPVRLLQVKGVVIPEYIGGGGGERLFLATMRGEQRE